MKNKLSEEKQQQLILALITEPTQEKACEVVGISRRTLYNYMRDEDFMMDYKKATNNVIDDTIIELRSAMRNGASELNRIINSDTEPTEVKLKAIRIAVDYGMKLAEKVNTVKTNAMDDLLEQIVYSGYFSDLPINSQDEEINDDVCND